MTGFSGTYSARLSSLPNKSVEHPRRFKPDALIERNRPIVRFRHSQRDEMEAPLAEIFGSGRQQSLAESGGAVFGKHAHLCDVPYVRAHLRTQNEADQRTGASF